MPQPTTLDYDPNLPVYASPEEEALPIPTAGVEQRPVTEIVDPALATVEGRTAGILAAGSPLTELAQSRAMRTGQARGLLSERGTVAAGTLAAMQEARAIATPDAALYGGMAQMQQKTEQDAAINQQIARLEQQKQVGSAALSAALTTHEQAGQAELQKAVDTAQMQRLEIDNQWKSLINFDQLDAKKQEILATATSNLGNELMGGIERTFRDPNIASGEAKEAAIAALVETYKNTTQITAASMGLDLIYD